jgi:hypothetical protein
MAFFDRFWGSRARCAPNLSRKRVRFSVELLESRLVPSTISGPSPGAPVAVPPPATPYQVTTTAGASTPLAPPVSGASTGGVTGTAPGQGPVLAAPALIPVGTQQNTPGNGSALVPVASGDYVVTWPSDTQDGTPWNGYIPLPDAPGGPQGGTLPINTAPAGGQTGATAPDTGDNFTITWLNVAPSGSSATGS